MKNFGGRQFGGRQFIGRQFRGPSRDDRNPTGGPDERISEPRRRAGYHDDDLMQIAIALVMSGALDH